MKKWGIARARQVLGWMSRWRMAAGNSFHQNFETGFSQEQDPTQWWTWKKSGKKGSEPGGSQIDYICSNASCLVQEFVSPFKSDHKIIMAQCTLTRQSFLKPRRVFPMKGWQPKDLKAEQLFRTTWAHELSSIRNQVGTLSSQIQAVQEKMSVVLKSIPRKATALEVWKEQRKALEEEVVLEERVARMTLE